MTVVDQKLKPAKSSWVEVKPYSLAFSPDQSRPILLFRDQENKHILPVWLSPLDAGITISQQTLSLPPSSPHNLTAKLLLQLGVELEKCIFKEVLGHHQYVELKFKGSDQLKKLRVRADEAMSFCMKMETRFFCKVDFIDECRVMDAKLNHLAHRLALEPTHGLMTRNKYLN